MNVAPATPQQVNMFKAGAAARFTERGVPADMADALFNQKMGNVAQELGLPAQEASAPTLSPKAAALVTVMKRGMCGKDHKGKKSYPGDEPMKKGATTLSKRAAALVTAFKQGKGVLSV